MKKLNTKTDSLETCLIALAPPSGAESEKITSTVSEILAQVKSRGDEAVLEYERKFDCPTLESLLVTEQEIADVRAKVSPELLAAIRTAKANIEAYHRKQIRQSWVDFGEDFSYGQIVRPIEKVAFYAPGGLAPYPSTVLMAAIPGVVAGVDELVMATPPRKDGTIHEAMLVAADECGVKKIYKIGGAQAIGALAFGTASVSRVDKIVGPGNAWVAEGKRQVFGIVGIDQIAGPSEILVIADDSANPAYVAADILSQAEHAGDSRCVLVTCYESIAGQVEVELEKQTAEASRADLIRESLANNGVMIVAKDMDECVLLANAFAPEHLEIATKDPWELLRGIKNAGAIMLGHYTPVPLCDFAAGPNHTLPTSGTARFSSGLSVDDYVKKSGLVAYSKPGLDRIGPTVITMAEAEGFQAHANTIKIRNNS